MKYRLLPDEPISEAPQKENLGGYLTRNVAKIPALAYEAARSGLGIGGTIAEELHEPTRELEKQYPIFKNVGLPREQREKITSAILPTPEKAYEEAQKIFPRYMVEKKENDYPAEFLLKELPLMAYSGAFKSIPALGKGIATTAGILGGSELGKRVGSYIGDKLGGQTGKRKGELVGGLFGGAAGSATTQAVLRRPTKFLKDKTTKNLDAELLNAEKELQKTRDNALENLKKDAFEREKKIKTLEETRHPEYAKAEKVAKGIKEPAPQVKAQLKKLEKNLGLGIEASDQKRITEIARQLEHLIDTDQLDLETAKTFKQRLNSSLYDKELSPIVKREFSEIRNSLNEHIKEVGKKYPEHGKPFSAAEEKTIELKKLKTEEADFKRHQKETMRDIVQNYNEDLRNVKREFSEAKSAYKTQEALVNNLAPVVNKLTDAAAGGLGYIISSFLGFGPAGKTIGSFVGPLIRQGVKESKAYGQLLREHPDLFQEYNKLIFDSVANNKTQIINRINTINKKFEQYQEPQPKRQKRYRLLD